MKYLSNNVKILPIALTSCLKICSLSRPTICNQRHYGPHRELSLHTEGSARCSGSELPKHSSKMSLTLWSLAVIPKNRRPPATDEVSGTANFLDLIRVECPHLNRHVTHGLGQSWPLFVLPPFFASSCWWDCVGVETKCGKTFPASFFLGLERPTNDQRKTKKQTKRNLRGSATWEEGCCRNNLGEVIVLQYPRSQYSSETTNNVKPCTSLRFTTISLEKIKDYLNAIHFNTFVKWHQLLPWNKSDFALF